ncbi:PQQ-binding-like beta-propeller repeat protein [Streptomyces sp. NPDC015350]|uniref:outer membrane protein assembly factor BamB family protein n=1 Tax=Streptomyces sp. NPDC015350 TaxID=3364955 RepID=UPI0037028CD6
MTLRVLGGRYELVAFIGRGGMGEVWEGHDRVIERRVAVKLLPHNRRDTFGAELFFREARTAGGLSHPGVVTVFDLGQDDDGTLYLVMEFLTGRDLDTVLREDGVPDVPTAVDWVAQTASALQAAHAAGVVHRDLKPANLMLTPTGQIKVLDFGIARYIASTHKSSKVIGTLAYMPPERFAERPADTRSDLYSLGCLFHELLTGSSPFNATDPVSLMAAHLNTVPEPPGRTRAGIPAALDDLVTALLAKDPDDRPATAVEVRRRLAECLAPDPVPAPAPDPAPGPDPVPQSVTAPDLPCTGSKPTVTTPVTDTAPSRAPVVEPAADPPKSPRPTRTTGAISRRTALRLGVGAAVGTAAGITAIALFDGEPPDGTPDDTPVGTSALRWRHRTGGAVASSPAVVDGTVYVGSDDKNVYALDAATGKRKWACATGRRVEAAPTVAGGVVYAGSLDNKVYALDAATGGKKWVHDTGHPVRSAPAVARGVVYVGGDNGVYALNSATGERKWDFDTIGGGAFSSPAVVGEVVYTGSIHAVYALDTTTGERKWISGTGTAGAFSSPTVVGGVVYISSVHTVHALDATTGKEKWAHAIESNLHGGCSTPRVVDGVVYVGSYEGMGDDWEGRVLALDSATGGKKWEFGVGAPVDSAPTVAGGIVYVGSGDRSVYALDAATGKKKWSYATGGGVTSSPAVVGRLVYVGSDDKSVYALNGAVVEAAARA